LPSRRAERQGIRLPQGNRENYDQLVQVKRKYDPGNLFHINQNIKP